MFSTGLSSGAFAGSGSRVMLSGTTSLLGLMPAGLIEQQHGMSPRRDRLRDLRQMQRHGLGRAARQHQAGAFALAGQIAPKM